MGRGNTSKVGAIEWGHNPKRARAPQLYYLSRADFIVIMAQMKRALSFQKRAHLPFVQKVGGALAPNGRPPVLWLLNEILLSISIKCQDGNFCHTCNNAKYDGHFGVSYFDVIEL